MQEHAESTIIATVWLIAHAPERLPEWLERHSKGLEAVARSRIEPKPETAER